MKRKTIFAVVFMAIIFITTNCFAQTDHQTFTLTVNGKETTVNLPKEVPNLALAVFAMDRCYDAHLCVDHYNINLEATLIISFWHYKSKIIGFVLHDLTQDVVEHIAWLYAADMPTFATGEEFNAKLKELYNEGG